ncbi:menaquinone biosynthesis prenyltransferase MqnP [Helicobacter anatolicus]|uniref:menaquinone biosynthesis prenyltransferase MqnP n=1 Tax=Helicobacter anatolicus TaxID=2905874 RepID=UPI001E3CC487|nr:menaquinone biosynthesis prenyltransferase MqnP [Helicobacter anatolicus]MCE3038279.1 4-hydroxybenzoate polyprenyltransferase [Helicobacter anatolicus]
MFRKIKNFSELVMFEHTVFSAAFSLMAIVISLYEKSLDQWDFWENFKLFLWCIVALIGARNFAMAFNRFCDRDIDSKNSRTKSRPSVDGRVGVAAQIVFCLINAFLFVMASYFINTLAFFLSFVFLVILAGYSYVKRFSVLAHYVLGVCLGLAPISGAIAMLGMVPIWSIALSLGVMFWVAGFDLLYSLQDLEFDKKEGLFSFPAKFGEKKTLVVSRISHILAVIFWLLFVLLCGGGFFAFVGLTISAIMLVYEQYIVFKDFRNIPKAFFVTNGYLGFVFLGFMILDVLARMYYA